MLQALRFVLRGSRLLVHLGLGLSLVAAVNLDFTRRLRPEPLSQWWNRHLLQILGIRVRVRGAAVPGGHLAVANHVSWLDISLIAACGPTRFVSKAEVRHWPIAGWLANAAGTFYLARGKHGTRPLLNKLRPYLQSGGTLTIFPEGTTTTGDSVLPFHARLFGAAIEAQRPVQPMALRYGRTEDGEALAPYVGDDVLLFHILALLRSPGFDAELTYLPPIEPADLDRSQLAQAARAAIESVLLPERQARAAAQAEDGELAAV